MLIKKYINIIKTPLILSIAMFIICGLMYPLLMTGVSQVIFPTQANGSMIDVGGKIIGSKLIGQDFTDARFMKNRPSAVGYNTYTKEDLDDGSYGGVSTGSNNFAPSNPALAERVAADIEKFIEANPTVEKGNIPADILTASGSGLDPHISPLAAKIQIPAISIATGLSEDDIATMVQNNTKGKTLGVFGQETVNVLLVNIEIAKALKIIAE